ncbi:EAL domain-containing protein, partial [Acidisphaera rubrifaciens]|uniref:EAL domain-containing protein n=1 Tax=Acidisphaera rubrifaciens TaxID=50715 RepID=UPI000662563C
TGHTPSEEQQAEAAERRRLESDLRQAIAQGRMTVHFQPRVILATGMPTGAEALLRWPHRKRGLIAPSAFLPYAERSGLITRLGGWVLDAACREARGWPAGTRLAVNVAARQISDGVLLHQVGQALAAQALPAEQLELELPEHGVLDIAEDTLLTLAALRDTGVGIVLDDYGAGQTSLAALRRLPLSSVKLDRSLVRGLPGAIDDAALARAIIGAAHALGLAVIAEGVETEGQRRFLAEAGCDEAQGHLFGGAMSAAALRPFLATPPG